MTKRKLFPISISEKEKKMFENFILFCKIADIKVGKRIKQHIKKDADIILKLKSTCNCGRGECETHKTK